MSAEIVNRILNENNEDLQELIEILKEN